MSGEVAIIEAVRTPFCRAGSAFAEVSATTLGRVAVRELLDRAGVDPAWIDHVVIGTVASFPEAANVARTITVEAGLPARTPAFTVNRDGASGLEAIAAAMRLIALGEAEMVIAGGVESMSRLAQATRGAEDAVSRFSRGETAEILAKEWRISREAQDALAAESHRRATAAAAQVAEEIVAVYPPSGAMPVVAADRDPRHGGADELLAELARLGPLFDSRFGTVTTGNSAATADGAAVCLVAGATRARDLGRAPLGRIRSYAVAAVETEHMGLGPAHAVPLALERARVPLRDIQLIELHETSSAIVLANEAALRSREFAASCRRPGAAGEVDPAIRNVNGGAIALGDPAGASGARLVLALLHEMRRRDVNLGLAAIGGSGSQGAAMVLER